MIRFERVQKRYHDGTTAIHDLTLTIETGQIVCLIGPSGCGKTTTLKMINRLIEPSSGTIYVNGESILSYDPVQLRRQMGYVIQQIGLFPHMTIEDNIMLVPKMLGWPLARRIQKAHDLLNMVGLDPNRYAKRYPRELSGGQQQRVGVLRALAGDPEILLMDEPFGALDPISRLALQNDLKAIQEQLHKTIVFVTHDMLEAFRLADRIIVMNAGQVMQVGSPRDLRVSPANEFIKRFVSAALPPGTGLNISAKEVMEAPPVTLAMSTSVAAALRVLRKEKNPLAWIVEGETGRGWVTHEDLTGPVKGDRLLRDIPHREVFVVEDCSVEHAAYTMFVHRLDQIPVVGRNGNPLGILTREGISRCEATARPGTPVEGAAP